MKSGLSMMVLGAACIAAAVSIGCYTDSLRSLGGLGCMTLGINGLGLVMIGYYRRS